MNERNVPEVRFRGFSGEWMANNIIDIAPLQRGFDLPRGKMQEGKYPVVMSNGVNGYHSEFKAKAPGVTTGRSGTIGKLHYIEQNYWPHNTALWVTDFKGNIPRYVFYMYQKLNLNRFGTGSGVPTLNRNDVHSVQVFTPNADEQTKIGEFFKNLDNLIAQNQKKYDKLVNMKKACLDKMFPKDGADTPEVRFRGFRGRWKTDTLGEITDVYDGTHQTPKYTESGIMFLSVENIKTLQSDKYISEDDFMNDFKIFPQKNDVLMTRIGDIGTANVVDSDSKKAYYVSLALLKYKKLNPYFLRESIHSLTVKREIWHRTLHIAFPKKINKNEIEKVNILFPNETDEQAKIGTFFQTLDTLITAQKTKLEKLKNIKKACLDKMFI